MTQAKLKENPLVLIKSPETGKIEGPFQLITWGNSYACVSTGAGLKWIPSKNVKPYQPQTHADDPGSKETSTQM